MTTHTASDPASSDPERRRRLVTAWVAEQAEVLDTSERAILDTEQPDWRAQAAQLIAEGLLAYVVLEMVAPDLAVARAEGGHVHTDEAELTGRLVAHLQDFIDYRAELGELGGLPSVPDAEPNSGPGSEPFHQQSPA
jgi:hypothetical protein